jgi:ribosomal protein S6
MAGVAPDLLLESDEEPQQPDKFLSYFEFWASQSPSNYRLYTVFLAESRKVHPLLARHYQQRFRYPRKKANIVATQALALFADRAAGSFPGSSPYSSEDPKRLSDLAKLTKSGNPDSATLKAILATNPPEEEIDQALKTALLTNKPKSVIHLLADSLKSMDHGDESALFFALPNLENVKLLLTKGASINYANGFGKTPLFYAVEKNQHALAEFLIRHSANPNHAYKSADELMENACAYNIVHSRRTPLMHAAQHADVEMLKLLIKHGARLQDVDDQGFNALDYAMKNQQTSNIKFLRSLGVRPNLALDAARTPTSGE